MFSLVFQNDAMYLFDQQFLCKSCEEMGDFRAFLHIFVVETGSRLQYCFAYMWTYCSLCVSWLMIDRRVLKLSFLFTKLTVHALCSNDSLHARPVRICEVWGSPGPIHITHSVCVCLKRWRRSPCKQQQRWVMLMKLGGSDGSGEKFWPSPSIKKEICRRGTGPTSQPCKTALRSRDGGDKWRILKTRCCDSASEHFSGLPEVIELLTVILTLGLPTRGLTWQRPRVAASRLWSPGAFFDALCCCCSSWRKFARLCGVQTEDLRWAVPPGAQQRLARHLLQVRRLNETFMSWITPVY